MGTAHETQLIHRSIFLTSGIRYSRYPANAAAIQVSGNKAALGVFQPYAEVVAAGVLPDPCYLYGATYAGVLGLTDTHEMLFDVGIGGVGGEVSLSNGTGIWDARRVNVGGSGFGIIVRDLQVLPVPILLTGRPRVAARAAQLIDAAVNHTWSISLHFFTGLI